MQKNSVNKSVYSKGFLAMIRDNFDVAVATDICRLANEYSDDYINTHPNAYGSAIKVCEYFLPRLVLIAFSITLLSVRSLT